MKYGGNVVRVGFRSRAESTSIRLIYVLDIFEFIYIMAQADVKQECGRNRSR
jgi:hypothetical protein